MLNVIRVLLDLSRLTVAELLARANAVYAGLNLNPAYPNPPIPLSDFRTAIDDFSAALTAALDGGAKAIAHRNARSNQGPPVVGSDPHDRIRSQQRRIPDRHRQGAGRCQLRNCAGRRFPTVPPENGSLSQSRKHGRPLWSKV